MSRIVPAIGSIRSVPPRWSAAVSEKGTPAERLLGSFELTLEDD
jgi:hypothetical protein